MDAYHNAYQKLNRAQKRAVETIDGPVLVLAGPGTGKTQLLSARVARILEQTDTPASAILCLTFTESGSSTMRERLTRFIGSAAYDVTISTYHAFGGDLQQRYPEYFAYTDTGRRALDELGRHELLTGIVDTMAYDNPLKQTRHHLGDLISTISELKRALLSSSQIRVIAAENLATIEQMQPHLEQILADHNPLPRTIKTALPVYDVILETLRRQIPVTPVAPKFGSLAALAVSNLELARTEAVSSGKTTPLTMWKNKWLAKNEHNAYVLAGELENKRMAALADVLEQYQAALAASGHYDFDDMIVQAIHALETHAELRYNLQERYLYVLLDEFQDTNAAQFRLVQLLTDNPVNEGRPNIMAVGDDDQAIYAFQGAQYSNMLDFYHAYRDVQVINLVENYRSTATILTCAQNVAQQIGGRLDRQFVGLTKTLRAAKETQAGIIERRDFQSHIAEYDAIAQNIKRLITDGVPAREIAVLAPKHRQLEPLVPYLNHYGIAVRYDRRENILEAPLTRELILMSQLVLALAADDQATANTLWPEVLSFDFWQLPLPAIWQTAWLIADDVGHPNWSQTLLNSPDFRRLALLFLTLATKVASEGLETMLDFLLGTVLVETHDPEAPQIGSPLRGYYTSPAMQLQRPELFYETLSHLTVLRARLREHQAAATSALRLADFVNYVKLYQAADQQIISTSPYNQQADAVQLMTVFKAKGLEFDHVFLPSCHDDVWGSSARGMSNKLTLPPNLQPIRYAGASDDERLRILFVALTRARTGLHLTSSRAGFSGVATKRLRYFDEQQQPDGSFQAMILPSAIRTIRMDDHAAPMLELLSLDWRSKHYDSLHQTQLKDLLADRLARYRLSPTHLIRFLDLEYAGPRQFFFDNILRFPHAPSLDSIYGSAIHSTLEWTQQRLSSSKNFPDTPSIIKQFEQYLLPYRLSATQFKLEFRRGQQALRAYIAQCSQSFQPENIAEKNFSSEGVSIGEVRLAGKIDRLVVDHAARTITVIDYKTGKAYAAWKTDAKLHRYRLQLYAYKLLVEQSRSFQGYNVTLGRLDFIEPDQAGNVHSLELRFDPVETQRVQSLITTMWQRVMMLDFPATDRYPATLAGIKQFEADLLDGNV